LTLEVAQDAALAERVSCGGDSLSREHLAGRIYDGPLAPI